MPRCAAALVAGSSVPQGLSTVIMQETTCNTTRTKPAASLPMHSSFKTPQLAANICARVNM
jgi:hypothetical protein